MCGRFAPSPSGRMHLGNLWSALLAWLAARSRGGRMVLRLEDLDPDRCTQTWCEKVRKLILFSTTNTFCTGNDNAQN